jgi:hypothetical protein
MFLAPACRAMAAAMTPIGPAPVMSTSSPTSGHCSAVWVALPKGSKIAPRSGSIESGCTQTLVAGSTM